MNIAPVGYTNFNNKNESAKPSFKMVMRSDIIWNGKPLWEEDKKFKPILNKAVKELKKPENKLVEYVKNFWSTLLPFDNSKTLNWSSYYIVQGLDAEKLGDASLDILKTRGDLTSYLDTKGDILYNNKSRLMAPSGTEQKAVITAHADSKGRIQIDNLEFKPIDFKTILMKKDTIKEGVEPAELEQIFKKVSSEKATKPVKKSSALNPYPDWPARAVKADKTLSAKPDELNFG